MSSGEKAAEDTKSVINSIYEAGEDARKNINSYTDTLLTDNKEKGGTDFHEHAKRTGDEVQKGADTAASKLDEMMDKSKSSKK